MISLSEISHNSKEKANFRTSLLRRGSTAEQNKLFLTFEDIYELITLYHFITKIIQGKSELQFLTLDFILGYTLSPSLHRGSLERDQGEGGVEQGMNKFIE